MQSFGFQEIGPKMSAFAVAESRSRTATCENIVLDGRRFHPVKQKSRFITYLLTTIITITATIINANILSQCYICRHICLLSTLIRPLALLSSFVNCARFFNFNSLLLSKFPLRPLLVSIILFTGNLVDPRFWKIFICCIVFCDILNLTIQCAVIWLMLPLTKLFNLNSSPLLQTITI